MVSSKVLTGRHHGAPKHGDAVLIAMRRFCPYELFLEARQHVYLLGFKASLKSTGRQGNLAFIHSPKPLAQIVTTALLIAACVLTGEAKALTVLEQRGLALLENMCAQCHSIGKDGKSSHEGAPPFRELDRRLDLDAFVGRLREGLASGHEDMPMFRFSRDDAHAVVRYIRSIQMP